MEIILGVLILLVIFLVYDKISNQKEPEKKEQPKPKERQSLDGKYKSKLLLTKTEYSFYNILKQKCDEKNLLICPKVRLEDFIQTTAQEKMKYRGYIKSRHIDFLICDSKLHIIAALELDDKSHNEKKAQEIDDFKNELYKVIDIPLYRIKTTDTYTEKIEEMLLKIQF